MVGAGRPTNSGSILGRARDIFAGVQPPIQWEAELFPAGKRSGREVYRLPYLEPWLTTSTATPPHPLMLLWRAGKPPLYSTYAAHYCYRKAKQNGVYDCTTSISETAIRE